MKHKNKISLLLLALLLGQFFIYPVLYEHTQIPILWAHWFAVKQPFHISIFKDIHFSVGDVVYSLVFVYLVVTLYFLCKKARRKKAFLSLLLFFNLGYFTYQLCWGFRYVLPPIYKLESRRDYPTVWIKKIIESELQQCTTIGNAIVANPPTANRAQFLHNVETSLAKSMEKDRLKEVLPLTVQSMKPSLFSSVMSYTGIAGYYNPFTAEAQYNPNLPLSELPFTLAHERAHQLGITREYEASFVGYLQGIRSENPQLAYSCHWYALKTFLTYLYDRDRNAYDKYIQAFSPKMKADWAAEKAFNEKYSGKLDTVFLTLNNLFLQGNGEDGSISYSYFLDMLIQYYIQKEPHLAMRFQKHK